MAISWHTQKNSYPAWLVADIIRSKPNFVKLIDPPQDDPFGGQIKVIGRTYMPDADSNALIWQGESGAEQWFNCWCDFYASRSWVDLWEGPNEPQPMWSGDFVRALNRFTIRLSNLMKSAGLGFVGMCWGVGWPRLKFYNDPEPTAIVMGPAVQTLADNGHYLGFHEYSAPAVWDGGGAYTLRYRKTIQELTNAGFRVGRKVVTECGIDGGVLNPPQPKTGWKTFCRDQNNQPDPVKYMGQLEWYDRELRKDGVEAATIFVATPENEWLDFEITSEVSYLMANYLEEYTNIDWAKGFYLTQNQDQTTFEDLVRAWNMGYRFVGIRAGSGYLPDGKTPGLHKDVLFDQFVAWADQIGFLKFFWWYLAEEIGGQAAEFRNIVGNNFPEMGIYGDFEHSTLTLDKASGFLRACDRNFADVNLPAPCGVYTRATWLDPRGTPDWESQGRPLWVAHWSDTATEPNLPQCYSTWEIWQYKCDIVAPFRERICVDRFNGTQDDLYDKYAPLLPAELKYYWYDGTEVDEQTFKTEFGNFVITTGGEFGITELRARGGGSCELGVKVLDRDGDPIPGVLVRFSWPDGFQVNPTNSEGIATMGMGAESCYVPPAKGPYIIELEEDSSDILDGAGWICVTNYKRFDVVFKEGSASPNHVLTVLIEGAGEVNFSPPGGIYEPGTIVTMTAVPNEGWRFMEWWGDVVGNENPIGVEMDSDKIVYCIFAEEGNDLMYAVELLEEAETMIASAKAIILNYIGG
jgi:hypothetical protein